MTFRTIYTSGNWKATAGGEDAFVTAWQEFAAWASAMPGAGRLQLVRDTRESGRYVSFGEWAGPEQVAAWKTLPEFRDRLARVVQHTDQFSSAELELVASAENGAGQSSLHYKKDGIATFDAKPEKLFQYMSAGNHPHAAFKSHRLVGVSDGVVTVNAEVYNPDGSTFETTIEHRLDPPRGIETTMRGGPFDGARFVHRYTPLGDRTRVDLEGDFPAMAGVPETDELAMIDGFLTAAFEEDTVTLRTWSPA
jgi:heme-degrading monooxygenase HmoA